jgi:bacterioferritin-associated ferredoxin
MMNQSKKKPFSSSPDFKSNQKINEIICMCNNIDRARIEKSILEGAQTLNEIFDRTTAGVGPCGGTCRRKLAPMLEHYLKTGELLPPQKKSTSLQKKKKPKAT